MRRLGPFLLFMAVTGSVLPAYARDRQAAAPVKTEPEKSFPISIDWQLADLNGKPVTDAPSFRIDDTSHSSGFSGCNNFSAVLYPLRDQKLAMGPVALTKKACDPARMTLERTFLGILHSGPSWDLSGGDLVIKLGTNVMRFRRGL